MAAFHKRHGAYPTQWHLLDMTFANGPYRVSDPGVRPSPEAANRWRPKGSQYVYTILEAGKESYVLQAENLEGQAEYEIRPGMEQPRKLMSTPEDELCNLEAPRGKVLPEPVRFMNAASESLRAFHTLHGEYPSRWKSLDFHWAMVPHKANEERVRPPDSANWNPLGSTFTYEIVEAGKKSYKIRSRNSSGLVDYVMSHGQVSPVPLD
jgi:hypothetical protein